jgi:hypothetical protein
MPQLQLLVRLFPIKVDGKKSVFEGPRMAYNVRVRVQLTRELCKGLLGFEPRKCLFEGLDMSR